MPRLTSGEVVVLQGWAEDFRETKEKTPAVEYVLPAEGTLLWYDVFAIPSRGRDKRGAESLIDFRLRPQVSAQIVGENSYASANEAARPLLPPEVRDDPAVHPPAEELRKAHFYRPLSPAGEKRYEEIWRRFLDSRGSGNR